ncbi:tRNA lysidine(34) synthetase TilS [Anaeromicropila herbilytica]|uniref:tRNA(Ile)-lysidine synthase n=1 Tax=Anaeromicropila herbilytica TaxID=2785025 RepID=A0A7R7IAZ6_9FIRM|nr:tRNA lysidine(34) synthetase TilS [Anaeromicropila herbilytica]BCN28987.1 tRNA(Ile)-lysidine synthase [Anaeromicropila herbilytica]
MINKVLQYIKANSMINEKDKIVLGVSGGADSVCLFFVMLRLREIYHLHLEVVHVNHGIRGDEAKEDEEFVKELCERENVPITIFHEEVKKIASDSKLSEEEAGRQVRYDAFYKVCEEKGCRKIAIAHNRNDSAETILFNLFRGSGIKGLTGIRAVRGEIIRPLLCVSRDEIEEYLEQLGEGFKIDKTNLLEEYTRNKIRRKVLPYVTSEINQKAMEHIVSSGNILSEVVAYIENNMLECYDRIVSYDEIRKEYFIYVNAIMKEDIVIQKELVRYILSKISGGLKDIENKHVEIVLELIDKSVGKKVDLPYDIEVRKDYDKIIFGKHRKVIPRAKDLIIENLGEKDLRIEDTKIHIPGEYYDEDHKWKLEFELINYKKNLIIPTNGCTKWFDYDRIKNTVSLRTRREGDFLQIDQKGSRKKIKSLFIDKKVPRELRDRIPLLADGDHIMWILGDRISEAYKVNEQTEKILIVKVDGGNNNG